MKKIINLSWIFLLLLFWTGCTIETNYQDDTFSEYHACFFTEDHNVQLYLFSEGVDLGAISQIDSLDNYEEKSLNVLLPARTGAFIVEQQFFIKKFGELDIIAEGTIMINDNREVEIIQSKGIFQQEIGEGCIYIKVGE